jgi:hypothetical protein
MKRAPMWRVMFGFCGKAAIDVGGFRHPDLAGKPLLMLVDSDILIWHMCGKASAAQFLDSLMTNKSRTM